MELLSISAMTVFAVATFGLLIASSQSTNLYSLRNLFMAGWLYYGFSVGIDLMTGAEIPYTPGEAHMLDPSSWGSVSFVMWNYVLCGIAFLITYTFFGQTEPTRPIDPTYQLRLPAEWFLICVNVIAASAFVSIFFSMSRMERMAMASSSTAHKFACLLVPLVLVLDIVTILAGKGRKAVIAWLLAVLVTLVTGNRNYVVIAFLVAAFRWRPELKGWKLVGMVASCGFMIFTFKAAYSVWQGWYMGDRVSLDMIYENLHFSLARMDADASYQIAMYYTDRPSPWWMGESYLLTPLKMTWPRFLGGIEVSTLAEHYIWTYHPDIARQGGAMAFSAMAEAWLNFSYLGAPLVGVIWGAVTKYFDCRPRGIPFYVVVFMIVRIFRSDFATIYKNWALVWGLMFFLVFAAVTVYTVLSNPRHQRGASPVLGRA